MILPQRKQIVPSDGLDRDSGGESERRARAGRDIFFSLSLPARAPCPGSPPLSQSTLSDGTFIGLDSINEIIYFSLIF